MALARIFESRVFPVVMGASVIGLGYCGLRIIRMDMLVRSQDYYSKPMILLQKYKPAEQFLGKPIHGGRVNYQSDTDFNIGEDTAKLCIPLKGSTDKGFLYVTASREESSWVIDELDLEIKSTKQRWKFYDKNLSGNAESSPSKNAEPSSQSQVINSELISKNIKKDSLSQTESSKS